MLDKKKHLTKLWTTLNLIYKEHCTENSNFVLGFRK